MKANLTLRLDEELIRRAKVLAAQRGTSLSRLVGEQIEELSRREASYAAARRRAEARLEQGFDLGWSKPATRGELHDRKALRR